VARAREAARAAAPAWAALALEARRERVLALARALEGDGLLGRELAPRAGLEPDELGEHMGGLAAAVGPARAAEGARLAWCAHDWRELVRAPLGDVAQELLAGRCVVLLSDPCAPELATALARAAHTVELPPGVVGLLHGARAELLATALVRPDAGGERLLASGLVDRLPALRRLEERAAVDGQLRAVRAGTLEVDPEASPESSAETVLALAFGRARTWGGQLAGALARVWCPSRAFSVFTERLLAGLEAGAEKRPCTLLDEETATRARAAVALGLDEGATCIAGGDALTGAFPPTVFTNVEPHMASARRQDPLPVLCLLRS